MRDEIARTRTTSGRPPRIAPGAEHSAPDHTNLDDTRVGEIPEIAARLEHAHLYVVASFAGGDDDWVDAAAAVVGGPAGLDAAALERLIAERRIDEPTARRVGFIAALYETVERDTTLTRIVREARLAVSNGPPQSTLDLARTSRAEWESALRAAGPAEHAGRSAPMPERRSVIEDHHSLSDRRCRFETCVALPVSPLRIGALSTDT